MRNYWGPGAENCPDRTLTFQQGHPAAVLEESFRQTEQKRKAEPNSLLGVHRNHAGDPDGSDQQCGSGPILKVKQRGLTEV